MSVTIQDEITKAILNEREQIIKKLREKADKSLELSRRCYVKGWANLGWGKIREHATLADIADALECGDL